jgi:hypothetical protein
MDRIRHGVATSRSQRPAAHRAVPSRLAAFSWECASWQQLWPSTPWCGPSRSGSKGSSTPGARELAGMLERNRTLKTLVLSANNTGDEGAGHLAAAMERNNTLEELYLGSNNIGAGALRLAAALERNVMLAWAPIASATPVLFTLLLQRHTHGAQPTGHHSGTPVPLLFGPLWKPTASLLISGVRSNRGILIARNHQVIPQCFFVSQLTLLSSAFTQLWFFSG